MTTLQPTWGDILEMPPATTAEDLLRLPDDGYRYELYEGKLVREMTSPLLSGFSVTVRFLLDG